MSTYKMHDDLAHIKFQSNSFHFYGILFPPRVVLPSTVKAANLN